MPVVDTTNDISLSEFLRLALPVGTQRPEVLGREQVVRWVVMAGPGVVPVAGDFVLCGSAPTRKDLAAWAQQGVTGVAVPAGSSQTAPAGSEMPVLVLPEGALLRDIQRAALELIVN